MNERKKAEAAMPPAVILAGGRGERMLPLTATRPKPLLRVGEKTVIGKIIGDLSEAGVREVHVAVGYMGDMIIESIGKKVGNAGIVYHAEDKPLGSAGCTRELAPLLGDEFIVMCGDAWCDIDIAAAVAHHRSAGAAATLVLSRSSDPLEYGIVHCEADGRIVKFVEKPSWSTAFTDIVNTGIYIMSSRVLEYIPKGKYDFGRDLFVKLLESGEMLFGYLSNGSWHDIGNASTYYNCNMEASGGKNVMGEGCRVADNAAVSASVLFENVTVGEGAEINGAVIAEGCVIGRSAYVGKGCVLGASCVVSDGARVGDGVVLPCKTVIAAGARADSAPLMPAFGESSVTCPFSELDIAVCRNIAGALSRTVSGTVGVMSAEGRECDTVKQRLIGGLEASCDLGAGFSAMAAFAARTYREMLALTVCVEKTATGLIKLSFFNKYGFYPGNDFEKSVQKNARTSPFGDTVRKTFAASGVGRHYTDYLCASCGTRLNGMRVLCGGNLASDAAAEAVSELGGDIVSPASLSSVSEVTTVGISEGGRRCGITRGGSSLDFWHLVAFLALDSARLGRRELALPVRAPEKLKKTLREMGVSVREFVLSPAGGFEGDGHTLSLACETPWLFDGVCCALRALGIMARGRLSVADVLASVPGFSVAEGISDTLPGERAGMMRILGDPASEGVLIDMGGGSVRVIARRDRGFTLIAEAGSDTDAAELIRNTRRRIENLRGGK